jgi:hypothetical protein
MSALRAQVSLTAVFALFVCFALGAAIAKTPGVVRTAYDSVTAHGPSWNSGELGPSFAWATSEEMVNAANTLPKNATYTIVFGNAPPLMPIERTGILPLFRYWLLPRRYTPRLRDAQWVITYHHSSETVGVPYKKEIGLGLDANTFKVTR